MKYPRLFWATFLPIAAAAHYIVQWVAPMLVPPVLSREQIRKTFHNGWIDACVPEPLEHLRYILAVLVPVTLMFGAVLLMRRVGLFRRAEPRSPWLAGAAVAAQLLLVRYAANAWTYESEHGWKTLLFTYAPSQSVIVFCVAAYLVYKWLSAEHKWLALSAWRSLSRQAWLAWLIAIGWTIAHLLSCVFTEANLPRASGTIAYHLPFTMGEFAAAVNGRVPLVDFYSQYENVYAVLLRPLFALIGITVTTYTITMSALSLIGFLLVFQVFSRVMASSWNSLLFYLPWVAVNMASMEEPGLIPANSFNYYAVGPIRYFGVFLLAYLSMRYLALPRNRRLAIAAFVSGLVALNNVDFGVPAALGVLTCAVVFPPLGKLPSRFFHTLLALAIFVGGFALALGTYWVAIRVACGKWPNLAAVTEYQRVFAVMGFNMLRLPESGLHCVMYLTFMVAVLYAVFCGFSQDYLDIKANHRLSTGMLAYGGVSGFGVMMYYVGRSHPAVLVTVYCAWAFVIALLAYRVISDAHEASLLSADRGYAIFRNSDRRDVGPVLWVAATLSRLSGSRRAIQAIILQSRIR